jgi:RNA polymerase sigma-70 factor (ECF subfamily)
VETTVNQRDNAFEALFLSDFAPVLRAAQLIVGDAELARDLTQDAFAKLFVHWRRVSTYDRPGAWVRRVAINGAISATRRRRRGRLAADAFERQRIGPEALADPADVSSHELIATLGQLPPQQRAAVVLFYLEDQSVADVAELLGTSEATVKVHLHRARQRLATLLHEEMTDVVG